MSKLKVLTFLIVTSLCASSCVILTPNRPSGGYRHQGYGFGHSYRHHYKRGHHANNHRCNYYRRIRR